MNNETRAEWDREVYDHERMTGQHDVYWPEGEFVDTSSEASISLSADETLATYTLQILGPALSEIETRYSLTDKRVLANLPAMLESIEEDLTDLLPEGYSASIKEWNSE